jgi:hypothetical protein
VLGLDTHDPGDVPDAALIARAVVYVRLRLSISGGLNIGSGLIARAVVCV